MYEEFEHADDLERDDRMSRPKPKGGMSKSERKKDREFRKNRQKARGRGWQ